MKNSSVNLKFPGGDVLTPCTWIGDLAIHREVITVGGIRMLHKSRWNITHHSGLLLVSNSKIKTRKRAIAVATEIHTALMAESLYNMETHRFKMDTFEMKSRITRIIYDAVNPEE